MTIADVIDTLAGIAPGSPLDAMRARGARRRASTRRRATIRCSQPIDAGRRHRCRALRRCGCFVAGLHGRAGDGSLLCRQACADRGRRYLLRRDRRRDRARPGPRDRTAPIPKGRSVSRRHGRPRLSRAPTNTRALGPARGGASSMRTCWCSIRAMRRRLPAGAARCRLVDHGRRDASPNSSPSCPTRSGSSPACASSPQREARMTDKALIPAGHVDARGLHPRQARLAALARADGAEPELTERHIAGLVDAARAKSPYFRLLARDPEVLEARTRTDKDIFYNPEAGLPRAERELAAAATSRYNGCIYCASVHARFAATYSKRVDDVDNAAGRGRRCRSRRALERDRRGVGGADRDADRFGPQHIRRAAPGRARRGRDRRRDQRRLVLQLGEPADAVARRALEIGNLGGIENCCLFQHLTGWSRRMSNIDRRTLVKGSLAAMMAGAAFSRAAFADNRRADPDRRQRPADRAKRPVRRAMEAGLRPRARRDQRPRAASTGRPLAYVFEDTQSDPRQSVAIAQKFVADPNASWSSSAISPARPRWRPRRSTSAAGLVQFGFTNSHPDFTKGGDFMWSNSVSQADEQPLLAAYAVKRLGLKRLAVLHLNTDWGRTSKDIFVKAAKEHGARDRRPPKAILPDEKDFRSDPGARARRQSGRADR